MSEVHVKGLAELQKFLDQLPAKMEANVMRGALRAGMKEVQPVAQQNVHNISGLLAKGLKIKTSSRRGVVKAKLVTTGKHAFVAKWVEFGTAAHAIAAKAGGSLFFRGLFAKLTHHPGAQAKPFMRPALDQQSQAAIVAAAEYMKKRLATKNGLNTSEVEVG
jgi:HK97 gp10 family phage protein